MTRLFDRICKVTVYSPTKGSYFGPLTNAIEITDHQIQFKIEKHVGSEPNTCEILITNLAARTRAALANRPLVVHLSAGHDGVARRVFVGDLHYGVSKPTPTGWETKLLLGDGLRAYANARVNRSYRPPISVHTVLTEAARSMGIDLPPELNRSTELRQSLTSGISLHGPTRDALTRLLAPYGYSWSIQDHRLLILRDDQASAGQAILVKGGDDGTGLLAGAERGVPSKVGQPRPLTFPMLLYPELTPWGLLDVRSRAINGIFKLQKVVHTGDTHGKPWTSEVEALPR